MMVIIEANNYSNRPNHKLVFLIEILKKGFSLHFSTIDARKIGRKPGKMWWKRKYEGWELDWLFKIGKEEPKQLMLRDRGNLILSICLGLVKPGNVLKHWNKTGISKKELHK